MRKKKVLGVFRDLMSAKIGLPILQAVQKEDVEIFLVVEGLAVGLGKESGLKILTEGDNGLSPLDNAHLLIKETDPDIVCIGCSSPINWELQFAKLARELQIPVVACEDIWGGLSRLKNFNPDLALVMDNRSSWQVQTKKYCVVGDIASTINPPISDDQQIEATRLETITKEKTVIMVVGDHTRNALEILELVANSVRLENQPDQFVITYSLVHPKLVGTHEGDQILKPAEQILAGLAVDQFSGLSTDMRTIRCNITVSTFSTPLRIALHHGQRAISAMGPLSQALMEEETGFSIYPLVENGTIPLLNQPRKLSEIDWPMYESVGTKWAELAKLRPEVGAEAILRLIES